MSRIWVPRTTRTGIEYGQAQGAYYWSDSINPGATFDSNLGTYDLALPNCTTYAYGRVLEAGDPYPITGWHNANAWHAYVTNGWTAVAYSGNQSNIQPGDILELTGNNNHVMVVEQVLGFNKYVVTESYYCDDNGGTSGYRTPAVWGSTLYSVNAYGLAHFSYQYWHSRTYDCSASGPDLYPDYILKNPNSIPDTPTGNLYITPKRKIIRRIRYV